MKTGSKNLVIHPLFSFTKINSNTQYRQTQKTKGAAMKCCIGRFFVSAAPLQAASAWVLRLLEFHQDVALMIKNWVKNLSISAQDS